MTNKKEPLSVNLSKLILTVSIIVCIGALFGAVGYLILNKHRINPSITIEENIEIQARKIMELNNIKEYSLKSAGKNKIKLPEQFEISKTILAENFPDFIKYINSDVWQVNFSGETKELEYGVIFDSSGDNVIAAFKDDSRRVPGIEPLKISFYLPSFTNNEVIVGEDFLITLPANPSTGYSWEADFDENYLMLRSKDFVSDNDMISNPSQIIVGAGGTEVFTFAPIKTGETTITMSYGRSWESKPSETKVFRYSIKEKTVQNQDVVISTDKTEYEQGETVKITVKNDLNKSIWYIKELCPSSCCNLQRWENNEWKNLGNPMPCIYVSLPPQGRTPTGIEPDILEMGVSTWKQWDMMIRGALAERGKYRFSFYYGLSEESYTEKTIYSNEFTIKEKIAIDPRCSQKVSGVGNCDASFSGYEFDSDKNKCVFRGESGCSGSVPFQTIEECQKVCERGPSMAKTCTIEIPKDMKLQSLSRYDVKTNDTAFKSLTVSDNLCLNSYASGESGYYLVQFDGPITEDEKKQFESLGGKLYGYVPQNSFIYKMDETVKNKVQALKFIKWIGIYQPAFRIAPSISDEMIKNNSKQILDVSIFDANYKDIVSKIEKLGGTAEYKTDEYLRVVINASKIPDIARINDVVWIALYIAPSI